mmetsp:Transcript_26871/g.78233  ORF Transcript_26871/g.78233 Transcript_26871/m.78233 type:complete len:262 (+) Transcript_26871:658-1443(+)
MNILARLFIGSLGTGLALGSDLESLLGKFVHEVVETMVNGAKHSVIGQKHVVEEELTGVLGLEPHLFQGRALGESWRGGIDKEEGDAVCLLLRCSLCNHNHKVGHETVGDVGLGAVEDVATIDFGRLCANARKVRPGPWFCHGNCKDLLSAAERRQVLVLLLFRAEMHQIWHSDVRMEAEARAGGRAFCVHLLFPDNGRIEDVKPEAAVLFRAVHTQQAHFASPQPQLPGHMTLALPLRVEGDDELREERPAALAERVMVR